MTSAPEEGALSRKRWTMTGTVSTLRMGMEPGLAEVIMTAFRGTGARFN